MIKYFRKVKKKGEVCLLLGLYENKTIAFLGDSIVEHGHYIYALRTYLKSKKKKVAIYNCGMGGMSADRVSAQQIDYDVNSLNADYCIVSFGVNDLGIWLYDCYLEVTEDLVKQRKERKENYLNGIKNIVKILKLKKIIPILMSPCPVNELLEEKPDIPTVGDNNEKKQLINPWFYKRQTFININKGLKDLNDWLKSYSEQEQIDFIDTFELIRKYSLNVEGLFNSDGIHYSKLGGQYIIRAILEALGNKRSKKEFVNDVENDKIYLAEREDRAIAFIRFNHFNNDAYKNLSEEEKKSHIEELLTNSSSEQWLKRFCQSYLKFYGRFDEPKKQVVELTKKYLNING